MAYTNATIEIRVGNVESRLLGPIPSARLDRALNPGRSRAAAGEGTPRDLREALVFSPGRGTVLTGAVPQARHVLRRAGYRVRLRDCRLPRRPVHTFPWRGPELRDYQQEILRAAVARTRGVVDIGTGGGKTLLAAALIHQLGLPALVLVTTRTLLQQTVANLGAALGEEPGVIGAGQHRPGPVTAALVQSLARGEADVSLWREGVVVFDEGHHACAPSYLDLLRRIDARYNLFLSAVPFRSGEDQVVLDALTGGALAGGRYTARYLIERGYAAPVRVRIERCRFPEPPGDRTFARLYRQAIVENPDRNRLVLQAAREGLARGASVLILVERVRHGEILRDGLGESATFLHGGRSRSAIWSAS